VLLLLHEAGDRKNANWAATSTTHTHTSTQRHKPKSIIELLGMIQCQPRRPDILGASRSWLEAQVLRTPHENFQLQQPHSAAHMLLITQRLLPLMRVPGQRCSISWQSPLRRKLISHLTYRGSNINQTRAGCKMSTQ
jgi:hypothetical protein